MCLYGAFQVAKGRIMQVQSPKDANYDQSVYQKAKTNTTTGKFRKFHPISKKLSPESEVGCPSYDLAKSGCQTEMKSGEGSVAGTASLNLTVKWPSLQLKTDWV